ncbi:MAG: class I adenylate-forming enzyme family protein [bacterium]|nr:class I adenylate-forming enzyme family protein [bacterium]
MTADLSFLEYRPVASCLEEIRRVAHQFPDEPALITESLEQTHGALQASVEATRAWLAGQGLPPGCSVLVLVPNCPEMVWLQLALLGMGCRSALIDVKTKREALIQIGQELLPAVLICAAELIARGEELRKHLPPRTVLLSTADLRAAALVAPPATWSDLSTEGRIAYFRMDREDRWRGAWFGLPQLGATAQQVRQLYSLHRGCAVLCQMPASHYLALSSMILPALCAAGHLVLLDRTCSVDLVLDMVARTEPRLMIHYRRNYWFLHRAAQQRHEAGQPLGRILHAVVNADSPQLPFRSSWEDLFQGHLLAGFATTWAGAFLALNLPWLEDREGFVGKALPGVDLRILDETGQERPSGRWGEVIFRSPGMAGELTADLRSSPEATEDGWLRSQQMAMMDTDGFLTLADEVFDVIWLHGFKVSPLEIEEPLCELPGVVDAAALGGARGSQPDQVLLFVQCETDESGHPCWTEEALREECVRLFPPYLRPSRIIFVDEIPYDDEEFKLRKDLRHRTETADPWRTT